MERHQFLESRAETEMSKIEHKMFFELNQLKGSISNTITITDNKTTEVIDDTKFRLEEM